MGRSGRGRPVAAACPARHAGLALDGAERGPPAVALWGMERRPPDAARRLYGRPLLPDDPGAALSRMTQASSINRQPAALWQAAGAAAGQRVPEESLPELLDEARRRPELRDVILPVLGKRGEWLVLRNPEWEPVIARYRTDEATWGTGSRDQRLAYLRCLR